MYSLLITGEVTAISHARDPEYYLLFEERNPVRKNSRQILVLCTFWGSPDLEGFPRRRLFTGLI